MGPASSTGELTYVLSRYLRGRGDATIQNINELIDNSHFWTDPDMGSSQLGSLTSAAAVTTLNTVNKQVRRFTLQQIVRQKMVRDGIDVLLSPTTTIPPYVLTNPTEPIGAWAAEQRLLDLGRQWNSGADCARGLYHGGV